MTAPGAASPRAARARWARRLAAVPAVIAALGAVILAVIVGRDRGESILPPNQDELMREFTTRLQSQTAKRAGDDSSGTR